MGIAVLATRSPAEEGALREGGGDSSAIHSKIELFVHDPSASRAFYAIVGFSVAHEKATGYTTLVKGPAVIALSPVPGWAPVHWLGFLKTPPLGTELVFYAGDLEATRAAFARAGYEPGEIALQAWGDLDFRLRDPDGYSVRISEGAAIPEAR